MSSSEDDQKQLDEHRRFLWTWAIIIAIIIVGAVSAHIQRDPVQERANRERMREYATDNVLNTFCSDIPAGDDLPPECVDPAAAERERARIREQFGHR